MKKKAANNSTNNKLAVQYSVETFVVDGNLVFLNYIRGEIRHLLVAVNR